MTSVQHRDLEKMPLQEKRILCQILDRNDKWEELAKLMQFSDFDIANFQTEARRLRKSPADLLISRWSSRYAHNVTELFKLLSLMQQFDAMEVIKDLVDRRYHVWFKSVKAQEPDKKMNNLQSQIFAVPNPVAEDCPNEQFANQLKELLNIPEIPIAQLDEATENWAEKNILGKGGFGTVYRGTWISTQVAIKKLEYRQSRSVNSKEHLMESLNELRHLNRVRHDNILPVYGYAIKDNDGCCFVVYQLMVGGSLETRLSKRSGFEPLTWPKRWNIAVGTARGLQYCHLYSLKPLIHGDIKPANILLDSCSMPKIGDFGLSQEGHANDDYEEKKKIVGTKPYLPKEYMEKNLFSTKIDVFSFGVVLFELATGYKSLDKDRVHPYLYDHMARIDENTEESIERVIDPTTPNDIACFNLCRLMIFLGKHCTNVNPNYRPEMMSVLKALENFKLSMKFGDITGSSPKT